MKVKALIQMLQAHDPEAEVLTDTYHGDSSNRSHGPVCVWAEDGKVWVIRPIHLQRRDPPRDFYRHAYTQAGDGPIHSYLTEYTHLQAKTEAESAEDLASGAISQEQHEANVTRIQEEQRRKAEFEERVARSQFEQLKARFEPTT